MTQAIFDGHNDFLYRLLHAPARRMELWPQGDGNGHLDLPRMRAGGFAGGFFAIYVPNPPEEIGMFSDALMDSPPYALPLPPMVSQTAALPVALQMARDLHWMAEVSSGALRLCHSVGEIEAARAQGVIAAMMHMEGAEAIDADLRALDTFADLGLRSIGPVWSRETIFAHGVPFRFPADPDTGDGLTDAGKRLVAACNERRIMIDLSHLNAKGVEDVARLSDAPLVATHSNAWAVTPSSRNLTDRQLGMIRDSGGMVGINFATVFLRPDGRQSADVGFDPLLRHLDHLLGVLGEDYVGFGSDFDGATVPQILSDVAGLPRLVDAIRAHGVDGALLEKLCWGNWMGVLHRTWGQ